MTLGERPHRADRWFLGWAIGVALVLLAPPTLVPGLATATETGLDKAGHFLLFLVLALLAVPPARARTRHPGVAVVVIGVLYGAVLEGLQAATGVRSAELGDLVADGVGSVAGVLAMALWRQA